MKRITPRRGRLFLVVSLSFALLCVVVPELLLAQERIDLEGAGYCLWTGGDLPEGDLFAFQAPRGALDFVNQMLRFVGLATDGIVVKMARVGNAVAYVKRSTRYILFDNNFIENLQTLSGSDWSAKTVFAHELGHHLNAHPLQRDADRKIQELEADSFSGDVLCRLGATLEEAQKALTFLGAEESLTHPSPQDRLDAVEQGWRQANEREACGGDPHGTLFESNSELRIDSSNIDEHMAKSQISAGKLIIDDVTFTADREVVFLSNRLELQGSAKLVGSSINIVAAALVGGLIDASGKDGEDGEGGGEIFIAAGSIRGTTIRATGGRGRDGDEGAPGTDGATGTKGRDGKCGPGMLGEFVGSKSGGPGGDGGPGGPGGRGGDGGPGGRVSLLTIEDPAVVPNVSGGAKGEGGDGGKGGRRGAGGEGGAGCIGLGGTQPTRANGPDGRPGPPGPRGDHGNPGPEGSVRRTRIPSLAVVAKILKENMTTEEAILQLRQLVHDRSDNLPATEETRR